MIQRNLLNRSRLTELENELMVAREEGWGRDSQGARDGHGHPAVFNVQNQQGPAAQPRELCPMSCGSLDGRGVWGKKDACTRMAESLCSPPETMTTVLIALYPNTKYKV